MSAIERVGVIGGGQMGAGIAEVTARAGYDVLVSEVSVAAAEQARSRIERSLARARERGRIDGPEAAAALARITTTADVDAHADRDLVIEAATEDEQVKLTLFERVGKALVSDEAILASNTSSIPIVKLGTAAGRPDRVLGLHFFNPAPVMGLVELIPSLQTSDATLARVERFTTDGLGKQTIRATDRAGFIVNSLLIPYLLSAIRLYEAGYAAAADIDNGMTLGCGHPMGPLALADLIGLDTVKAIGESMYEEFKEPLYAPPPLLDRMVDAGLLGTKSGQGFHPHPTTR